MCTTGRNNPTAAKANHKIQPYAVLVFRYIKIQNHAKMCLKSFSYGSDIFWDMKQYAQILAESKAMKIQSLCSSPRVGEKKIDVCVSISDTRIQKDKPIGQNDSSDGSTYTTNTSPHEKRHVNFLYL